MLIVTLCFRLTPLQSWKASCLTWNTSYPWKQSKNVRMHFPVSNIKTTKSSKYLQVCSCCGELLLIVFWMHKRNALFLTWSCWVYLFWTVKVIWKKMTLHTMRVVLNSVKYISYLTVLLSHCFFFYIVPTTFVMSWAEL